MGVPSFTSMVASSCPSSSERGKCATEKSRSAATIGFVDWTSLAVWRDRETKPLARLSRLAS